MKVYNYHPVTGEFLSVSIADPSPLEKGVFLIPAHATMKAPPTFDPDVNVPVFQNGDWVLQPVPQPQVVENASINILREPTDNEKLQMALCAEGLMPDILVHALWAYVVEDDPTEVNAIKAKVKAIKEMF